MHFSCAKIFGKNVKRISVLQLFSLTLTFQKPYLLYKTSSYANFTCIKY